MLVRGEASDELKQRFLREAADPEGDVRRMLRSAQKWASTALNSNCPSPIAPDEQAEVAENEPRFFRRAAFSDSEDTLSDRPVSQHDLTEVIIGTASQEIIVRVRNALEDPFSTLSSLVRELPEG
jgi:hypothetical protein